MQYVTLNYWYLSKKDQTPKKMRKTWTKILKNNLENYCNEVLYICFWLLYISSVIVSVWSDQKRYYYNCYYVLWTLIRNLLHETMQLVKYIIILSFFKKIKSSQNALCGGGATFLSVAQVLAAFPIFILLLSLVMVKIFFTCLVKPPLNRAFQLQHYYTCPWSFPLFHTHKHTHYPETTTFCMGDTLLLWLNCYFPLHSYSLSQLNYSKIKLCI